jgi:hypothetical protein
MADIVTSTAQTAGFLPQLWANRALDVLRSQIVLAKIVARDSDFNVVGYRGQSVTVPYPGEFTATDKSENTPVTPATTSNGNSVTVTLDHHKIVPFAVEDFAAAQANLSLMDRYLQPATVAIAEQLETDLWTTASSVTGGPVGSYGTDIDASVVRDAVLTLNQNKAPQSGRSLVVSPKDHIALIGDTNLSTYWAFSQPQAIENGYLGRLYGLDVYMSQLAPVSGSDTTNLALHTNAVLLMIRPFAPIDPGQGVMSAQANDPDSGLSIRVSTQYSINDVAVRCNLDILYGSTVLRANQGVIVKS